MKTEITYSRENNPPPNYFHIKVGFWNGLNTVLRGRNLRRSNYELLNQKNKLSEEVRKLKLPENDASEKIMDEAD